MSAGVSAAVVAGVVPGTVVGRSRGRGLRCNAACAAGLAGAACDRGDASVGACKHAADRERPAGSVRPGLERGDADAVAAERDVPRHAVPVLVDLELDLDAAVFAAQLEFARGLLRADTADDAMVASLGGCG